jgi:hypothetical protein
MARTHKNSLSNFAGRKQRIHELAEAAQQILREFGPQAETNNFNEVIAFFKNPPNGESDGMISDPKKR